jgi:hypothetical protein
MLAYPAAVHERNLAIPDLLLASCGRTPDEWFSIVKDTCQELRAKTTEYTEQRKRDIVFYKADRKTRTDTRGDRSMTRAEIEESIKDLGSGASTTATALASEVQLLSSKLSYIWGKLCAETGYDSLPPPPRSTFADRLTEMDTFDLSTIQKTYLRGRAGETANRFNASQAGESALVGSLAHQRHRQRKAASQKAYSALSDYQTTGRWSGGELALSEPLEFKEERGYHELGMDWPRVSTASIL